MFNNLYKKYLGRHLISSLIIGSRLLSLLAKFALTFFITKFMGLESLGIYGLVASGATLMPAIFGLGLNGVISRHAVLASAREASEMIFSRISATLFFYIICLPIFGIINFLWIKSAQLELLALIFVVLFLENLSSDMHSFCIARSRINLASTLFFLRSGLWPVIYMICGYIYPNLAEIKNLLMFWFAALLLNFFVFFVLYIKRYNIVHIRIKPMSWLIDQLKKSWPFYISDIGGNFSLYFDRFLISTLLFLYFDGIYTFFWSLANAINNVVFFGVIQPTTSKLVVAHEQEKSKFSELVKKLYLTVAIWGVLLVLAIAISEPYILKIIHKEQLYKYSWVLYVLLASTFIKLLADAANLVLYSSRKDLSLASIAVLGMIVSASCLFILIPIYGFEGAVFANIILTTVLLISRLIATKAQYAK